MPEPFSDGPNTEDENERKDLSQRITPGYRERVEDALESCFDAADKSSGDDFLPDVARPKLTSKERERLKAIMIERTENADYLEVLIPEIEKGEWDAIGHDILYGGFEFPVADVEADLTKLWKKVLRERCRELKGRFPQFESEIDAIHLVLVAHTKAYRDVLQESVKLLPRIPLDTPLELIASTEKLAELHLQFGLKRLSRLLKL